MQTRRTQCWVIAVMLIVLAVGSQNAFAQVPEAPATQAAPRVDLFGGYSYQRLNSVSGSSTGLNGWAADMQTNIKGPFALATSFSGGYGNQLGAELQLYTFLAGPRLMLRTKRANVFIHGLLGGARLNASAAGVEDNATSFATALGGGVDVKLTRRTAVRLFQTDYLLTRMAANTQHNFRVSTGIVVRLGGPRR